MCLSWLILLFYQLIVTFRPFTDYWDDATVEG